MGKLFEGKRGEKSKEKSSIENAGKCKGWEKILEILRQNPKTTTYELMLVTKLSQFGVEKVIRQLKDSGKIRSVGPDKFERQKVDNPVGSRQIGCINTAM